VTSDVLLREVLAEDLPVFFEHQLDPDASRMAAFPSRERDAHTAHWTKILRDDSVTKKTVIADGQVAGNIVSFDQSGRQMVGYWIGKDHWGKGIATQALAAFLDHVPARPLYAYVAKDNVASIRVLEKCGFTVLAEGRGSVAGEEGVEEFLMTLASDPPG
jgi:RimJ/RimL family protein N-acetyltransferase